MDEVTSISEKAMMATEGIESVFKLKADKAEVPEMYSGGGLTMV